MSVDAPRRSLAILIALTGLCLTVVSPAQPAPPPAGGGPAVGQPPPDVTKAAEQLTKAHTLQIAKKYTEAVAAYQEFIRLAKIAKIAPPPIQAAYSNMAQCYQLLNDVANYKATLHTLIELDPKNSKALVQLAITAGAEHRFDEAMTYSNKTLALKPEAGVAAAAHFVLGNVAVSHQDFTGAAREFGQATQLMPKNAMAHYNYGLALAQEAGLLKPRQPHDSTAQAQMKKYTDAQKELETAVKLDPNNTNARFYLARLKQQLHPTAQADSPYDVILKKDPHNVEALKSRAEDLDRMGPTRISDAISAYLDAIAVVPNWFEGHYNVARLYNSISNFTASKQHFIKAHEIAAQQKSTLEDTKALGELGFSEFLEGPTLVDMNQKAACYKSAEVHLKQALALIPKEIDQKPTSALTPTEAELKKQEGEIKTQLAAVDENMGQFDSAIKIYRDLLTLSPDSIGIYTRFANLYKRQGKVDDYIKVWKEYQAHNPKDPTSYQNIGDIYRNMRQLENAITEWKLLIKTHQTNSTLSSTLVAIAQELIELNKPGNNEEADADYKTVLDMKPSTVPKEYQMAEDSALKREQYLALQGLADLAAKQNKTEESIHWLTLVLKEDEANAKISGKPMDGKAYHDIALLYEKDKKLDLALNEYQKWSLALAGDPIPWEERGRLKDVQAQSAEARAKLLETQGKHAESVAASTEAQGLIKEAVSAYQSGARNSKDKEGKKDPIPDNLKAADVYQRHKMYDKAVVELEALNKQKPRTKEVMTPLAQIYRETHQDAKALALYDILLDVDPSQQWVRDQKAVALMNLKRYDEAKAIYVQELDRNPLSSRQTYADLALVYEKAGEREAFLNWLKPRFEKTPANATLMAVIYDEYVTRMQEAEGQKYIVSVIDKVKPVRRPALEAYANQLQVHKHNAESLEVYRTVATENPKDMHAWMNLADQLDFNGRPDDANKIYLDQIARADITDLDRYSLRRQLGLRYVKQSRLEDARATLQMLHTQTPTNFDVAMILGAVLINMNHDDEALTYYQKLLDIASYPLVVRADIRNQIGALYVKEKKIPEALSAYHETLKLDAQNTVALDAIKKLEATQQGIKPQEGH